MTSKYLIQSEGNFQEVRAINVSAGDGDAGKIPALDDQGRLSNTMMPKGFGDDAIGISASEDLSRGQFVSIFDDNGEVKVRGAIAKQDHKANGFILNDVTAGDRVTVYFEGIVDGLQGLTPGKDQFLSVDSPGGRSEIAPVESGAIIQKLGVAISPHSISFEQGNSILLA